MRARISPHCSASRGRTAANRSSRRIRRAIVSPSTRSMIRNASSRATISGSGTPARAAAERKGLDGERGAAGAVAAQDQWSPRIIDQRVERPRLAAGAAGQPLYLAYLDGVRDGSRSCWGSIGAVHQNAHPPAQDAATVLGDPRSELN